MATIIMSKQKFLDWFNKNVNNTNVILLAQDMAQVSLKRKKNEKTVAFAFAADAFKDKEDVSHFVFGKTPVMAFSVAKKTDLSNESLELLKQGAKHLIRKNNCNAPIYPKYCIVEKRGK